MIVLWSEYRKVIPAVQASDNDFLELLIDGISDDLLVRVCHNGDIATTTK